MHRRVPGRLHLRGRASLYIHPDECVDCGACEPVCPVEAIYYEDDLPDEWQDYYTANVEFFDDIGSPGGAAKVGRLREGPPASSPRCRRRGLAWLSEPATTAVDRRAAVPPVCRRRSTSPARGRRARRRRRPTAQRRDAQLARLPHTRRGAAARAAPPRPCRARGLSRLVEVLQRAAVRAVSSVNSGALMTPATQSPESPRRTETSPLIKLIRATPRLRSSGSCARTGVSTACERKHRTRHCQEPQIA